MRGVGHRGAFFAQIRCMGYVRIRRGGCCGAPAAVVCLRGGACVSAVVCFSAVVCVCQRGGVCVSAVVHVSARWCVR
jgi:hypothetical protein